MKRFINRKYIFSLIVFIIFTVVLIMFPKSLNNHSENKLKNLKIGGVVLKVELADTNEEIAQGLSNRSDLPKNQGMLFVLEQRRQANFWMKDMKFSIDIIWIDNDKVVGVVENASLPTTNNIPTYTSPSAVTHVLEVNAGFVKEKEIQIGDSVQVDL